MYRGGQSLSKLAAVICAICSTVVPRTSASFRAVSTIMAGSLRFPRVGDEGEIRGVGLDVEEAVVGCDAGGFADVFGGFEGEDASVAEVKAEGQGFLRLRGVACEAVHDSATGPVFAEDGDGVVPGFAGVDGDGEVQFAGLKACDWAQRGFALDFAGEKSVVVMIEADFAEGSDFGIRGEGAQIVERLRRELRGVVRMDAD